MTEHCGEVSFPGGGTHGDETPLKTALHCPRGPFYHPEWSHPECDIPLIGQRLFRSPV